VAPDSCPVDVHVRENNLKTGLSWNRFDKARPPRGDRQAQLGIRIHYPQPQGKKLTYFWGYRNHAATSFETELLFGKKPIPLM